MSKFFFFPVLSFIALGSLMTACSPKKEVQNVVLESSADRPQFKMERVEKLSECNDGPGIKVITWKDSSPFDEIPSGDKEISTMMSQMVCDGKKGENGENGAHGATLTTSKEPGKILSNKTVFHQSNTCPTGGNFIEFYRDDNENEIQDAEEFISHIEVCNGINGVNGQDGAKGQDGEKGPAGPASKVVTSGKSLQEKVNISEVELIGELDPLGGSVICKARVTSNTTRTHLNFVLIGHDPSPSLEHFHDGAIVDMLDPDIEFSEFDYSSHSVRLTVRPGLPYKKYSCRVNGGNGYFISDTKASKEMLVVENEPVNKPLSTSDLFTYTRIGTKIQFNSVYVPPTDLLMSGWCHNCDFLATSPSPLETIKYRKPSMCIFVYGSSNDTTRFKLGGNHGLEADLRTTEEGKVYCGIDYKIYKLFHDTANKTQVIRPEEMNGLLSQFQLVPWHLRSKLIVDTDGQEKSFPLMWGE